MRDRHASPAAMQLPSAEEREEWKARKSHWDEKKVELEAALKARWARPAAAQGREPALCVLLPGLRAADPWPLTLPAPLLQRGQLAWPASSTRTPPRLSRTSLPSSTHRR